MTDLREDVDTANGIKFHEYSAAALSKALLKALVLYDEKPLLERFRQNAISAVFSWEHTARAYVNVYQKALAGVTES